MISYIERAYGKYTNLTKLSKASLWFVFGNVMQRGISFLTTPIFTRLLSSGDYGYFSVFLSWENILVIVVTLNLSAGVFNNGMLEYKGRRDEYCSSMIGLSTCLTIGWFIISFILKDEFVKITGLNWFSIILLFGICLTEPAINIWMSRQRFEFKYVSYTIVSVAYALLSSIVGIIAVFLSEDKVIARCVAYACCSISVFACVYCYILIKGKEFFNKEYWKYAVRFNLPLVPHYLSSIVLQQSDRIMINNYCGSSDAGKYSVASAIASVFLILNSSLSGAFMPWIYNKLESKDTERIKEVSNTMFLFIGACTIVVSMIAPEIVFIMAPEEYRSALLVVPLVSASIFFMFVYSLVCSVEYYYKMTKIIMGMSIFSALLNVVLNHFFIPVYGYYAAGVTTLVCYIVFAVMHYCVMVKASIKNFGCILFDTRFVLIFGIGIIIANGLSYILYNNNYIRYGIVLLVITMGFFNRRKIFEIVRQK